MKDCKITFKKVGIENGLWVYAVRLNDHLLMTANTKQIEQWSDKLSQLCVWVANSVDVDGEYRFPIRAIASYYDEEKQEEVRIQCDY